MTDAVSVSHNFIRQIVIDERAAGKHGGRVATRFPPEPNGYLHLGHGKSICLNFGIAREFGGSCNLRFDDTNPTKEDIEYVESIKADVRWLGFDWTELRHASDYFEVFYRCAEKLIRDDKAFVCDLSADQVRDYRGTLTEPGRNSPFRNRSADENLDLFRRMRAGEFADGARTLRAKIDMASGNINLRDPALYRIRKVPHQNTGDAWCIYPMYDYAHCISDAVEGITHSLCTLEFEDHRPLYDWCLAQIDLPNHPELVLTLVDAGLKTCVSTPRQIEFARGNLDYTVMSKRKLMALVQDGLVAGWDDPRMPTLSGVRRRGFPPAAIRTFWERAGVTKQNSTIEFSVLEGCVREVLDASAPRRFAVLDPLKLTIANLADDHAETLTFPNHPKNEAFGTRTVAFSRAVWIEREDFMEVPAKGYFRLYPGNKVRLRYGFVIECTGCDKDAAGKVSAVHCNYYADSKSGTPGSDAYKVKGNIHWVSAKHAYRCEVRLYDRLFRAPHPGAGERDFLLDLNPEAKKIVSAQLEPGLQSAQPEERFQFERHGYFVADMKDSVAGAPVFNRAVTLKDTWQK